MQQPTLHLGDSSEAFSKGGNRLCFVDPGDSGRCIKVLRPDRSPEKKRSEKSLLKRLKPLDRFNDNLQELHTYQLIERHIGEEAFELVPRCYGLVNTNLGEGLSSELIRDDDGQISITLKQYLWQQGETPAISACLQRFGQRWSELGMPSRNLLLHNVVVQCQQGQPQKLIVIDGLGWSDTIPVAYWIKAMARRKAARKVRLIHKAIDQLLYKKAHNLKYGYHGWLTDEARSEAASPPQDS